MKDLKLFGTESWPLHPSGLSQLMQCPWRLVMSYLFEDKDEGGQAADTGSAMHKAAQSFHGGSDVAASLGVMQAMLKSYPRADLQDAATMFLAYSSDPRNTTADVVLREQPISFSIAPAPEDQTQAPIAVIGTLDQVRRVDGKLKLFDIKTSKKDPMLILQRSMFQAAAYCVGATVLLNETVEPGAIIMPRRYRMDAVATSPVFYYFPWRFKDIEQILKGVRHLVARVRAGDIWHTPNDDCCWCVARSPDLCLPKLIQVGVACSTGA